MNASKQEQEVLYFKITDVWKRLCEEHNTLLDQTCEEYSLLLSSEMDLLEEKTSEKEKTISRIHSLERLRSKIITQIEAEFNHGLKLESISDVIKTMEPFEARDNGRHLFRFNSFLIDIIEKIQVQNKKNHLFINKALANLKTIREEALGMKSYSTYNKSGGANSASLSQR